MNDRSGQGTALDADVLADVPYPEDSPPGWRVHYMSSAAYFAPGILAGFISGALIGGVGGRLAMFVLRLTSDASLRGMQTDDEFTIGRFSGDTVFLVVATAILGAAGGLLYLGLREWLPPRARAALFGLLGATAGGALVIRPDGVDFTLLEPLLLAVAMFVFLPAVYGIALSLLTERFLRSPSPRGRLWAWAAIVPLAAVMLTGPVGVALFILLCLAIAANRYGRVTRIWRSTPVTWLGRGLFAAVVALSGLDLARKVGEVL